MLGDDVLAQWRVEDHDARDDSRQVDLGMVGDVPVFLDREWVTADLRITTGFVEPHFFAGFCGGPCRCSQLPRTVRSPAAAKEPARGCVALLDVRGGAPGATGRTFIGIW